MSEKTVYHGSRIIVKTPDIRKSRPDTDFGPGFYCTEIEDLAMEWACSIDRSGYSNRYEIDMSSLKSLDLNSDEYTPLHWLAILVSNRSVRISAPIQKQSIEFLLKNYLIDIKKYDIIIGPRADDSYFAIVEMFLMNTITIEQLNRALNLGDWGDQFVIKSKKAYESIRFVDATPADHRIYYPKRKKRDEDAVTSFQQMLREVGIEGTYMRDILSNEKGE